MLPNTYINFQAGTQMGDKLILGGCPPARGNPVKKSIANVIMIIDTC